MRLGIPGGSGRVSFIFLLLLLHVPRIAAARWTEEDERKRNNKIKEDEIRDYETKLDGVDPFGRLGHHKHPADGSPLDYGADIESSRPLPMASHPQSVQRRSGYKRFNTSMAKRDGLARRTQQQHWCFSCTSPWSTLSGDMQQVVRNLFDVRRAAYPRSEVARQDCTQPESLNVLPRETCANSYCQTLILTDHERGKAFTVRGCAEKFGAVDAELLDGRGDNTCKRLHPNIDLMECICKQRRYCYSGADRTHLDRFNSEAYSSAVERSMDREVTPGNRALSPVSHVFLVFTCLTSALLAITTSMLSGHANLMPYALVD